MSGLEPWMAAHLAAAAELAAACGVPWWVGGSVSLRLLGLAAEPADVDCCLAWQAGRAEAPIRAWADARGWDPMWVHAHAGHLLALHVVPAPRRPLDVFFRYDCAAAVAGLRDRGGWPVHAPREAERAIREFWEQSGNWRKWDRALADLARLAAAEDAGGGG